MNQQNIGDKDCRDLIKYDWTKLATLDLQKNKITEKGLQTLFQVPWPSLKKLLLGGNNIHQIVDFKTLIKNGSLPMIKYISLIDNPIDSKNKQLLKNLKTTNSDVTIIV